MKLVYVEGEITGREKDMYIPRTINADKIRSVYPPVTRIDRLYSGEHREYYIILIETTDNKKYVFMNTSTAVKGINKEVAKEIYNRLLAALPTQEKNEIITAYEICSDDDIKPHGETLIHSLFNDDQMSWGAEGVTNKDIARLKEEIDEAQRMMIISRSDIGHNISNMRDILEVKHPCSYKRIKLFGYGEKEGEKAGYVKIDSEEEKAYAIDLELYDGLEENLTKYERSKKAYIFLMKTLNRYTGRNEKEGITLLSDPITPQAEQIIQEARAYSDEYARKSEEEEQQPEQLQQHAEVQACL